MKRVKIIIGSILAGMTLFCSSCTQVNELINSGILDGGVKAFTGEQLYSALESAMISPSNLSEDDLPGTFTFSAYVETEPEEIDVEGEMRTYQSALISRNDEEYLLLDVTDLNDMPEIDTFISVTGACDGSLYWTEDNERVTVLSILVESFAPLPDKEITVDNTSTVNVETPYASGAITFKGAHLTKDSFGKVAVIYFDFTNTGTSEAPPILDKLWVYAGESDERLSTSIFSLDEVDGNALQANKAGISGKTQPGKTTYYYIAYKLPEGVSDNLLHIKMYDDDFHLTNDVTINVDAALN